MGTVFTHGNLVGLSPLNNEIEQSLKQIFSAFQNESSLLQQGHELQTPDHLHHHHSFAASQSSGTEVRELLKKSYSEHRARSVERYGRDELGHVPDKRSSELKREWQCHLCHRRNESDLQLCLECGSNKINVYIPRIEQNNRTKDSTRHHRHTLTASTGAASSK